MSSIDYNAILVNLLNSKALFHIRVAEGTYKGISLGYFFRGGDFWHDWYLGGDNMCSPPPSWWITDGYYDTDSKTYRTVLTTRPLNSREQNLCNAYPARNLKASDKQGDIWWLSPDSPYGNGFFYIELRGIGVNRWKIKYTWTNAWLGLKNKGSNAMYDSNTVSEQDAIIWELRPSSGYSWNSILSGDKNICTIDRNLWISSSCLEAYPNRLDMQGDALNIWATSCSNPNNIGSQECKQWAKDNSTSNTVKKVYIPYCSNINNLTGTDVCKILYPTSAASIPGSSAHEVWTNACINNTVDPVCRCINPTQIENRFLDSINTNYAKLKDIVSSEYDKSIQSTTDPLLKDAISKFKTIKLADLENNRVTEIHQKNAHKECFIPECVSRFDTEGNEIPVLSDRRCDISVNVASCNQLSLLNLANSTVGGNINIPNVCGITSDVKQAQEEIASVRIDREIRLLKEDIFKIDQDIRVKDNQINTLSERIRSLLSRDTESLLSIYSDQSRKYETEINTRNIQLSNIKTDNLKDNTDITRDLDQIRSKLQSLIDIYDKEGTYTQSRIDTSNNKIGNLTSNIDIWTGIIDRDMQRIEDKKTDIYRDLRSYMISYINDQILKKKFSIQNLSNQITRLSSDITALTTSIGNKKIQVLDMITLNSSTSLRVGLGEGMTIRERLDMFRTLTMDLNNIEFSILSYDNIIDALSVSIQEHEDSVLSYIRDPVLSGENLEILNKRILLSYIDTEISIRTGIMNRISQQIYSELYDMGILVGSTRQRDIDAIYRTIASIDDQVYNDTKAITDYNEYIDRIRIDLMNNVLDPYSNNIQDNINALNASIRSEIDIINLKNNDIREIQDGIIHALNSLSNIPNMDIRLINSKILMIRDDIDRITRDIDIQDKTIRSYKEQIRVAKETLLKEIPTSGSIDNQKKSGGIKWYIILIIILIALIIIGIMIWMKIRQGKK